MAKAFLFAGIISVMFIKTSAAESIQPNVSFQVFYDELLPYGDWIADPVYGYVWVPYAGPDFQPYASNGYWVMSTYGNTWVSSYDWGWAPFHYGRWYFDDYLGWAWVPGYEWGPAWVNWRSNGNYYGWAPLMPGINIHVAVNIPSHYWVFVPRKRLISRNIYNYYIPRKNVYTVYNQTTVINNTYVYNDRSYVSGPSRREVERATRRSVPVYQVNNSNRAGRSSLSRNTLEVYQPAVRQTANPSRTAEARPSRVLTPNEHKAAVVSRRGSDVRSSAVRTAPANSRRTGEAGTVREAAAQRREVSPQTNRSNSRVQSPVVSREASPSRDASPAVRSNQHREATPVVRSSQNRDTTPAVRSSQNRRATSTAPSQAPAVRKQAPERRQATPQVQHSTRTRTQSVQRAPSNHQVRTQQPQRNSSAPRVSSGSTRERSGAPTTRSSSPSGRSRGGN